MQINGKNIPPEIPSNVYIICVHQEHQLKNLKKFFFELQELGSTYRKWFSHLTNIVSMVTSEVYEIKDLHKVH